MITDTVLFTTVCTIPSFTNKAQQKLMQPLVFQIYAFSISVARIGFPLVLLNMDVLNNAQ